MPTAPNPRSPTVVIGAGPHGLSVTAHLRAAELPVRTFGDLLGFWRETMPAGMLLRSPARASSISDPLEELSLRRWSEATGGRYRDMMPLQDFIDYGSWFAGQAAPGLDSRQVVSVRRTAREFEVELSDGDVIAAGRVVVAAGLSPFACVPPVFASLPPGLAYHSSASPAFKQFAQETVAVIGSGQSALESAALLKEAGAQVELIARAPRILWLTYGWSGSGDGAVLPARRPDGPPGPPSWRARHGLYWHGAPTDVGGRISSWIGAAPDMLRHTPRSLRAPLTYHCIRPAGAAWLPDRLRDVTFTLGRTVISASPRDGQLLLELDDGGRRLVDRVLLGTGYDIDVRSYRFLPDELTAKLAVSHGSPKLRRGLESSISGLHFVGAPAAESFGPVMRFVVGTAYTGRVVSEHVLGRRRPAFRFAF